MTKDNSQLTTQRIYQQIREVLIQARSRALQAVNIEMVACYWQIGRLIVEEEQQGKSRAEYGKRLIRDLSKRLSEEFGKGFDRTNLQHMRTFYLGFSNCDALRRELSWTHYRLRLRVEKPEARAFYEAEAVNSRWSTRELERQINSPLFERLTGDLSARFGRGFSYPNLNRFRRFYLTFPLESNLSTALIESNQPILSTPSRELRLSVNALLAAASKRFSLPWSAYVRLLSVKNGNAKHFYEAEALRAGWPVRQFRSFNFCMDIAYNSMV